MRILKIAALVLLLASPAYGNETYFLPGDAFFFVRLDQDSTLMLKDQKSTILQYGSKSNGALGCGYIGYKQIELTNTSAMTKTALVNAFGQFKNEMDDDLKTQLVAPKGGFGAPQPPKLKAKMNVFIYSSDYDWKKHGIGIQYLSLIHI